MALCQMMGPQGPGTAMVKQNSILFAASRVAQATKHSPNFKAVMVEMCERKKITIQGLNKGENKLIIDVSSLLKGMYRITISYLNEKLKEEQFTLY